LPVLKVEQFSYILTPILPKLVWAVFAKKLMLRVFMQNSKNAAMRDVLMFTADCHKHTYMCL